MNNRLMKKYGLLVLCVGITLFGVLWINSKTNETELADIQKAMEIGWKDPSTENSQGAG